MFGLCELQNRPGLVEDGCLAVDMSPNLELPSDWTFILDAMPMVLSAEATPESMSRYGDAERDAGCSSCAQWTVRFLASEAAPQPLSTCMARP